eukprot:5562290-Alexandrium_andersonii.AAC.1
MAHADRAHTNNNLQVGAGGTQRKSQPNPLSYILTLREQLMRTTALNRLTTTLAIASDPCRIPGSVFAGLSAVA